MILVSFIGDMARKFSITNGASRLNKIFNVLVFSGQQSVLLMKIFFGIKTLHPVYIEGKLHCPDQSTSDKYIDCEISGRMEVEFF